MALANQTARETETYIPIPLESLPARQSLLFPVYLKVAGQFVLFRKEGDELTSDRLAALGEKTDLVFVPQSHWNYYWDSLQRFDATLPTEPRARQQTVQRLRHALLACSTGLEHQKGDTKGLLIRAKELCKTLATYVHATPELATELVRRHKNPYVHFSNHMINVSIYATSIGKKLGFDVEQLRVLSMAAMVHDVGKLLLPQEVLYREGDLSVDEQVLLCQHTDLGADLLKKLFPEPEIATVALQHHEKQDGSGYPEQLQGDQIHLYAKICAIADVYDSLTSVHPRRRAPFSPVVAIEMMKHMKKKFDTKIFQATYG